MGAAVSIPGDLPQTTGTPGSLSGEDLDIIDITSQIQVGDTKAVIEASTNSDASDFYLGGLVCSLIVKQPSLAKTTKTFINNTRTDGINGRGDEITYTITVPNDGNEAATEVIMTDKLPAQVHYKIGSLSVSSGLATYDAATRTIIAHLGAAANPAHGGQILPGQSVTVTFTIVIDDAAAGVISNQAIITAKWPLALPFAPPLVFQSGDGTHLNVPTQFFVTVGCQSNTDCPIDAPICDPSAHECTDHCSTDADCAGLPNGPLVCETIPNSEYKQCIPSADLALSVETSRVDENNIVNYTLTVVNQGPGTPDGATLTYTIPEGGTVQSIDAPGWDCAQSDGMVLCARQTSFLPGTSHSVKIAVSATPGLESIPFHAAVVPVGLRDPDLGNNEKTSTTQLSKYFLNGGGFSCNFASDSASDARGLGISALGVILLASFLGSVFIRSKKRG